MFKQQLQKLWKNRLVKSVLVVASGTAGAQAIGLAFIPFITRTYGPEVYGTLGAFIALTGVLTTLAALAYPVAIVLPKSDNAAKALVKLSLLIAVTISLVVLGVLWLAGDWIMPKLGAESLVGFMFFIPLVMLLTVCQDVAQQWLIRKKAFKSIAKISIVHSFTNYGTQALIGLYVPLASVLIGVHALAIAIRSTLTGFIGSKLASPKESALVSMKQVAHEYRDFPIYRAPQIILSSASQSLPVLMLTAFFGPAIAGFYTLTRIVLSLPVSLLGASVQSVFYPHFNEVVLNKGKTLPLLIRSTTTLIAVGIWPSLIIIFLGPYIFELVFGQEWNQAGVYGRWMSVWLFFVLISRPAISSIPVFKMQKWFLKYELISSLLRVLSIYLSFKIFNSAYAVIITYSFINVFIYAFVIIKILFVAKDFDGD